MPLGAGLLFMLLLATVRANHNGDPHGQDVPELRDVKHRHFLAASRPIRHAVSQDRERHRTRRATLFTTGVRVCPQDSMKDVISSHRAYYKLRICQEAVWEAFRVFLDRVPNMEEYRRWVHICQRDALCLDDIARNFSSTQEHLDMVARKVAIEEQAEKERGAVAAPEPGRPAGEKCSQHSSLLIIPAEEASEGPILVSEDPKEQVVTLEFSMTIVDPGYSEQLRDPESPQYHDVMQDLHNKMLPIFNKLPGFKEMRVLGFRSEDVSVRYAVVFDGDSSAAHEAGGTLEAGVGPDMSALKDMVVSALMEEPALPVDVHSIIFETDVAVVEVLAVTPLVISVSEGASLLSEVIDLATEAALAEVVEPTEGLFPTLAEAMDKENSLEAFTEMYTYLPFIPEELSEEVTTSFGEASAPPMQEVTEEVKLSEVEHPTVEKVAVDTVEKTIEVLSLAVTLAAITEQPQAELVTDAMEEEGVEPEPVADDVEVAEVEDVIEVQPEGASLATTPEVESEDADLPEPQAEPADPSPTAGESMEPLPPLTEPQSTSSVQPEDDIVLPAAEMEEPDDAEEPAREDLSTSEIPEIGAILLREVEKLQDGTSSMDGPKDGTTSVDEPKDGTATADEPKERPGEQEGGRGFFFFGEKASPSTASPAFSQMSTPMVTTVDKGKELVVFFSLRVTNMLFSDDLFNKSSPEYRSLENTFLELLLPYLQSNLTGFRQLEVLSFRNGSVVVNSKMRLDKLVPYNVTEAVHCILEDFCSAAAKRLDIQIDSRSLDIEPADQGDPCRFLACNEFSRCVVNSWDEDAQCRCDPGYSALHGGPCQSVCSLEPDHCLNGGLCEVIQGHGATCRCPVGKFWHYRGDRCGELVTMPLDPSMVLLSILGSLLLVGSIVGFLIFMNNKCAGTRKTVTLVSPHSFIEPDKRR